MMDEDFEVLSDSSDTIILPADEFSPKNLDDDEVNSIVNKYISNHYASSHESPTTNTEELNADDDVQIIEEDLIYVPPKKLQKSAPNQRLNCEELESSSSQDEHPDEYNTEIALQILSEKYKSYSSKKPADDEKSKSQDDKEVKKLQKQQKSEERQRKKMEAEREKALKQAQAMANKNIKPGECMKFIHVHLDNDVVDDEYGTEIINALQAADIKYTVESQIFPNTVSWTRKIQSHQINDDGNLALSSQDLETDEVLLIMKCKEFIEHVHNNTLITHIQSLKSVLVNKKITLIIYNFQNYTKFLKKAKQKDLAAAISDNPSEDFHENFPRISMKNIEYALTELEMFCKCSHRLLNSPPEVALAVTQFSKAVAEIPYKLQRHEKMHKIDWFASGDNRDCVKIDKNGNGTQRLWKQMLTMFPLANLETAEAIIQVYPTMKSLMQAYQDISVQKPELLLQDIPIRRAAGPLSSSRRLGPELSKKIYNFFTSLDGDTLL